jgi:acyl-CoA reductase-like NAD-dependent aldehyde dehydrogenase
MDFERIDPMTNTPASKAQAMTAKEACAVADRAAAGFEAWSQLGPSARRATLSKAASSLEARKDQFVAAMMSEVGATAGWAMFDSRYRAAAFDGMCCSRSPLAPPVLGMPR